MTTATKPASDKQIALIDRLAAERDIDTAAYPGYAQDIRKASALIDAAFAAPRKAAAQRPGPGFYVAGEDIVKVQANRAGTNVYAKILIPSGTSSRGRFEYRPGLIDQLAGASTATVDDMAAWGARTGTCGICGALLTNPESIERGIGPICASRM